jgi:hypothetical protein
VSAFVYVVRDADEAKPMAIDFTIRVRNDGSLRVRAGLALLSLAMRVMGSRAKLREAKGAR